MLPQTTTDAGYTDTTARITAYITQAENIVNGKVVRRYDISAFTSTSCPPMLQTIAKDICCYYVMRALFAGDNQNASEWAEKFKDQIGMLDEVRDGKIDLFNSAGVMLAERSTDNLSMVDSNTKDYSPSFGEDSPLNWKVDGDKLDDISNGRS